VVTFADVEQARGRIRDKIYLSPCAASETLSQMTGARVWLKLENLQMTGSFKERGAANKLLMMSAEERARGVICASAGNHAQGVAYHASRLGVNATIVMPSATPLMKVQGTRQHGARVVLFGSSYDDAYAEARRIQAEEGRTFVHPFDDALVIAGQGTVGLELLEQNPYLEAVVLPIGGGGLAAGVAIAIKETNPKIKVYGVETRAIPSMKEALRTGIPEVLPPARTIAEGIAVRRAGELTLPLIKKYVDDIALVDEEEIAEAILVLLEREKTVAEGAGAAPLAALLHHRLPLAGKKVAIVVSGGNIDVNVISRIIERGLVKSGRTVRLMITIPDAPGSLARVAATLGESGANIQQVHHDRTFARPGLGEAVLEAVLETRGFDHIEEVKKRLVAAGYFVAEASRDGQGPVPSTGTGT
jgi:threonine dehydratase